MFTNETKPRHFIIKMEYEGNQGAETSKSEAAATDSRTTVAIDCGFDHTYLRSIEGILRVISLPIAVLFFILRVVGAYVGGWWFGILVVIGWIMYCVIVIVIEVFITGLYVHRLIDGIILVCYVVLWFIVAIVAIVNAAVFTNGVVGAAAFFAIVLAVLIGFLAFFAFRTWRTYEAGRKGSVALFII